MELNRDKIIKAYECCTLNACNCTGGCPYRGTSGDWIGEECWRKARNDAYALFKELIEENEYLKQQNEIYEVLNKKLEDACESYAWTYGTAVSKELFLKKERENTVREMQKRLTDRDEFLLRADYDGIYYIDHACWVNQVAAEILGEE